MDCAGQLPLVTLMELAKPLAVKLTEQVMFEY